MRKSSKLEQSQVALSADGAIWFACEHADSVVMQPPQSLLGLSHDQGEHSAML